MMFTLIFLLLFNMFNYIKLKFCILVNVYLYIYIVVTCKYVPKFPFGNRFRKQGSSKPLGAWMEAFKSLKSLSNTFPGNDTSLHEPTDIWFRFRPSPRAEYTRIRLCKDVLFLRAWFVHVEFKVQNTKQKQKLREQHCLIF